MYHNRNIFEKNTNAKYANLVADSCVDISISQYGFEQTTKEKAVFTSKNSPLFSLHFVSKGELYLTFGKNQVRLGKNSFFLLMPKTDISFQPNPSNPGHHYWVSFQGSLSSEFMKMTGLTENTPYGTLDKKVAIKTFNALHRALFCKELGNNYTFSFYETFYFLANVVYLSLQSTPPHKENSHKPHGYVNSALNYINNHYTDPDLSIVKVSYELGLHERYLSRIFRKETSTTFVQFLTQKRIDAAIKLMADGVKSVSDIAYSVGFKDPFYFSSVFKKYHLISPSEHIKQLSQKNKT